MSRQMRVGILTTHYGPGNSSNPTMPFRDQYLTVGCPVCGASRGSKCRSKRSLAMAKIHRDRVSRYRATTPEAA
jgi:hypothetical protein